MELGDGVVGVQQRRLLVHFTDDLMGEERDRLEAQESLKKETLFV